MIIKDLIKVKKLVGNLYWDYDRLSSDGKDTLNNISNFLVLLSNLTPI